MSEPFRVKMIGVQFCNFLCLCSMSILFVTCVVINCHYLKMTQGGFMMENENIQKEAQRLEKIFQDAISGDYSDEKYKNILEIVNFMKNLTENFKKLACSNVIFIIGPTGAGKSTLMNYLSKEDNLLVSEYGKLFAKDSIADIGEGTTGSTTLFPNTWKHSNIEGVFIDCAGDFDSRGVLMEAINSKIKTLIANSVKSAKMLFVIPQASLSAEGAYGKIFKEALGKNAEFFNDINHFRDNIVLVISHANRNKNTYEIIDILLCKVMEQSSLSNYTDTIKYVIDQKNMVTFCKPSEEASSGSSYKAPTWNIHERKVIIDKINALNFAAIPQKDFFKVSSSLEVKEQMDKALTIVKKKAAQILMNAVEEAVMPKLIIYATELKLFADFLKHLINKNISAGLEQYIKYLNYNNFLVVSPDPEVIRKLTDELKYLESFTIDQQNSNREKGSNYDWNNLTGIRSLLHNIYDEVIAIINKSSELFTEFDSYNNLIVKGGFSDSESVKKKLKELHDKHKDKCNVESLRYNTNSKYYYDIEVQEFNYMEREPYTRIETYMEDEPFTRIETYEKDIPYTRTEYYYYEEEAPIRTGFLHVLTLGVTTIGRAVLLGSPLMTDTLRRSREVTYYRRVLEEKEVKGYKTVAKTKNVTDYRDKPVYKCVTRKQFNESEYSKDIKKASDFTIELLNNITEILTKMKLANQKMEAKFSEDEQNKVKMNVSKSREQTQDQCTTPFRDLYEEWKFLEYQSLFLNKPNMSLDIKNMELLLGQDIPLVNE